MEAMEGYCSFEGAACIVGRKVLFKFRRSHTVRQLLCDDEGGFPLGELDSGFQEGSPCSTRPES